jgi:hypothetical protein
MRAPFLGQLLDYMSCLMNVIVYWTKYKIPLVLAVGSLSVARSHGTNEALQFDPCVSEKAESHESV